MPDFGPFLFFVAFVLSLGFLAWLLFKTGRWFLRQFRRFFHWSVTLPFRSYRFVRGYVVRGWRWIWRTRIGLWIRRNKVLTTIIATAIVLLPLTITLAVVAGVLWVIVQVQKIRTERAQVRFEAVMQRQAFNEALAWYRAQPDALQAYVGDVVFQHDLVVRYAITLYALEEMEYIRAFLASGGDVPYELRSAQTRIRDAQAAKRYIEFLWTYYSQLPVLHLRAYASNRMQSPTKIVTLRPTGS